MPLPSASARWAIRRPEQQQFARLTSIEETAGVQAMDMVRLLVSGRKPSRARRKTFRSSTRPATNRLPIARNASRCMKRRLVLRSLLK